MNKLFGFAVALCAALPTVAAAQNISANGQFSFQGRLTTANGEAVADGQHNVTVNVFKSGSSTAVYTETDIVTTVDGVFSTMVGDNGNGGSSLMIEAGAQYDLGVAVDNQAEFSPRLRIGDAVNAVTADVAANAQTVGGVSVSTAGNPQPGTLVPLDANGRLSTSLLGASTVTSINGLRGNVNLDVTGQGVTLDTTGGMLRLNITGSGGGSFALPFSGNLTTLVGGQSGFKISGMGEGSVANFLNTGTGSALRLSSSGSASGAATLDINNTAGSAINAMGSISGDATLRLRNTASANGELIAGFDADNGEVFNVMADGRTKIMANSGTALDVTTDASADAALRLKNTSTNGTARLITAVDAGGDAVLDVMADGRTKIMANSGTALDVTTAAAGEAALKVTGGLTLNGPVGTGTIDLSNGSVTINNPYVKANSIIMVTVTSASNIANVLPVRVSAQGNGNFTASAIGSIAALTGTLNFNYLVINQ